MNKRFSILVGTVAISVVIYHLNNFRTGGYPKLLGSIRFTPWPKVERGEHANFDLSAGAIKGLGYLTRFKLGQESEIVARGPTNPYLYLYDRRDTPFFFSESVDLMRVKFVDPVRRLIEELGRRGVEIVLLPVPPKQVLHREYLPKRLPSEDMYRLRAEGEEENPRRAYQVLLDTSPGRVVDLYRIYENHVKAGGDSPFIPWDLHWNSLGIALAAEGVLENLRSRGFSVGQYMHERIGEADIDRTHRLLSLFQLPSFYAATDPSLSWKEPIYRVRETEKSQARHLASGTKKRLIMMGSSFCDRWKEYSYGLGKNLATLLGRTEVDYCVSGGGFTGAWEKIRRDRFQFFPGDLVVWEIILPAFFDEEILPRTAS